ncbi:hypothetical protein [Cecembia calidifontis]|jgi:hypothetical protein|uniref:Uncharacterized protein n=1 Tax=Cecembia calidifontis TaxID=1187080 RepID=A0A4Q7PBJ5_9BACT|nr:hypothetical protein [Cecembia calidifontis]RZS97367.1 hypothetical protein BC751_2973 [Cecembia calidifontis]
MKKILLLLVFTAIASQVMAQSATSIHSKGIEGCYTDYFIAFTERGASPVTDGQHDVVISIINQGKSECYFGKATVKEGKLQRPVLIQKDDLSFVEMSTIFKSLDPEWLEKQDKNTYNEVSDGMSHTFLTQDKYEIRLFFYTFIHPTQRANRKAPPANVLLKK